MSLLLKNRSSLPPRVFVLPSSAFYKAAHHNGPGFSTSSLAKLSNDVASITNILCSPEYSELHRTLREKESGGPLDTAANFILSRNISIPQEALENEQNFYTNTLHVVKKINFKKNFPLKLGDWSKSDLGIVVENLKILQQSLSLTDEETREIFSSLKCEEDRAKKNIVGYWCCQGLSTPRDPSEVFQKVRSHLLRGTEKLQSNPGQVETRRILESGDHLELLRNLNISGESQRTPLDIAGRLRH